MGLSLMACWSLSSCGDNDGLGGDSPDDANGTVALDLQLDPKPLDSAETDAARSSSPQVSLSDLVLTLTDIDRKKTTTHTVEEFSEAKELRTGPYKLEASFGQKGEEGWGKLYCYGSSEFRVHFGKLTEVKLPVKMANSMVEVNYSDSFDEYLTDITTTVITEAGNAFDWESDKTEGLYISPGSFSVSVSFTKPNGMSATAIVGPYNAEAKHLYAINLDVDYGEVEQIVITIDDTIDEQEETIDISDENLPSLMAAPEVTLSDGYTMRQTIHMIEYDPVNTPLTATVIARGRIASAVLATQSSDLVEIGFPASIDLCNPGSDADKIKEMGLESRGFAGNKGVFGVIDFTRLLSNIPYRDNGSNESTFRLTVSDTYGNEVTFRLFTVSLSKLELNIPDNGQLVAEGSATINVECNASAPEFEAKCRNAASGSWMPLTVSSATKSGTNPANGNTVYSLNLSGSGLTYDRQIPVRIYVADQRCYTDGVITVPSTYIDDAKTDAFAKNALVSIIYTTDDAARQADKVTLEISTDGSSFTPATATLVTPPSSATAGQSGVYKITGLNPTTDYIVYSMLDGEKSGKTDSFTTEATPQLPNNSMNDWSSEKVGDYQYLWYPGADNAGPWATVNQLTTSTRGSGSGNGLSTGGTAYKATSGTIPANGRSNYSNSYGGLIGTNRNADGHTVGNANLHSDLAKSPSNAALIRTVGYGTGNTTAAGTGNPASGFATCQNVAAGELYLGTYDSDSKNPVYSGYDFKSRPSAVTFEYKYVSYGSSGDYGDCEVIVYDADGEKIAESGVKTINAQGDYTSMTLPLEYNTNNKAAKIMVRFKSSANPALTNNSTWLYGPGNKNVSGGEYVGSELYIDDITLIY